MLPRLQVRSAVSGVTHIGLTLDAISSTASGASVALYDWQRVGGRSATTIGGNEGSNADSGWLVGQLGRYYELVVKGAISRYGYVTVAARQ